MTFCARLLCAERVIWHAAGHEEAERLERLIVKDFRNELKGHKERLQQSHRVRDMLDIMQERAKKLVSLQLQHFNALHKQPGIALSSSQALHMACSCTLSQHQLAEIIAIQL